MLCKCSFGLATLLLFLPPLQSQATLNESIKLTIDPNYSFYNLVSVEQDRMLLGLSEFDPASFTEQISLYSVDQNYELNELYQYPEAFDSEVGVRFLHLDNTLYSVAWEGIYQVNMDAFTAQKIPLPDVIYPTETMETFNYEWYFQSFPRITSQHLYVYEMAVWDESSLSTLAKISRLENGEFVDYNITGFNQGARTTEPFEHELGIVFRDEENWYILPHDGDMLNFPLTTVQGYIEVKAAFGNIIYLSGGCELTWIRQNNDENIVQEVLVDFSANCETFLGYVGRTNDNHVAFATVDESANYRIHLVTKNGLLPPIEVELPNTELSIGQQISRVYLNNDESFGFIRIMDSFLIFDAVTGQIQDPQNRFEVEGSTEYAFSVGDAILVLEKPSRFAENLSKATFIDKNLNSIDVTDQLDSSINPDCLYFSYFGENGYLNSDIISNCPAEGHYVVSDTLQLVQTPAQTDRETWRFSNHFFEFNNLRHSIAGTITGELSLLSWHGSDDFDLDGVPDSDDAFPEDLSESVDTDLDGIGNNADTDDDGDGIEDVNDPQPLVPNIPEPVLDDEVVDSSGGSLNYSLLVILLLTALVRRAKLRSPVC